MMAKIYLQAFFIVMCWSMNACKAQNRQMSDAQKSAAYHLIKRIIPAEAKHFVVEFIPDDSGRDVFELQTVNKHIHLRGNNGVSIASALNYYLEHYAHCQVTWNGSNLKLPDPLPVVKNKIRRVSPYRYRYYLNYCTFNYTMSWWNWQRWEQEIDWMALHGINMPLAITGENAVWTQVYKSMGFRDADLKSFFSGPAYFSWFYMGNLDGWGGPLPQHWIDAHEALQKKILAQERALGMTPVLPAFTGHVPPSFQDKFPKAKIKQTQWVDFPPVSILSPEDSLFGYIGRRFIQEEIKTYGTDHLYSADTFNENTPPSDDSGYLSDVSKKVFASMTSADPAAKWIMQGWLFYNNQKFWQPAQIKALLNGVPDGKMIILDLWSECHPVWDRTEAYYGKPWIWNMLHNFGGNISLYGQMDKIATLPSKTLHDPASGNMVGIGLTPEGIEQNPVIYQLMLENVWQDTSIDVKKWLNRYVRNRYGTQNKHAEQAWEILWKTVYSGGIMAGGPESIITARPTLKRSNAGTNTNKNYRPKDLLQAWWDLVQAADGIKGTDGFQYDLVDVTRQVLVNYADTLQRKFASAYERKDIIEFKRYTNEFLSIISDVDRLLATRREFLLGKWLEDAKSQGDNLTEKRLYERNARDLITLWGGKNSSLHEYSCRQWSGMLNGFYKPRWQQYFSYLTQQFMKNRPVNQLEFDASIKDWEWHWVNGTERYRSLPSGNSTTIAKALYKKYYFKIKDL